MIIVRQGKKGIMNFDNVEFIGIGNPLENNEGKFLILADTTSDNQYELAKYDTEERAKEVLQEIIIAFVKTRFKGETMGLFGFSSMPNDTFFEMPEA